MEGRKRLRKRNDEAGGKEGRATGNTMKWLGKYTNNDAMNEKRNRRP
jgi:hypothetical protein